MLSPIACIYYCYKMCCFNYYCLFISVSHLSEQERKKAIRKQRKAKAKAEAKAEQNKEKGTYTVPCGCHVTCGHVTYREQTS